MRITILTIGSRGDIEPLIELGRRLAENGHSVRVATHENFEELVTEGGLEFFRVARSSKEMHDTEAGRGLEKAGANPFVFIKQYFALWKDDLDKLLQNAWSACQDAELVMASHIIMDGGFDIAEKLKIPFVFCGFYPCCPTTTFPTTVFPQTLPNWKVINRLSYEIVGILFWVRMRKPLNKWRTETLKLKPLMKPGVATPAWNRVLSLYGYSPKLLPKPADWPENCKVTGYWCSKSESQYAPSQDLLDFLNSGETPICVGFGSMVGDNIEQTTEIVKSAVKKAGQRAVIISGWGGIADLDLPDNLYFIRAIPHAWLFPRVSLVVHHGGAGTAGAVLRAGIPSVVVPYSGDQFFWGQRIFELGLGSKPLPRRTLCAEDLASAILSVLEDNKMREAAKNVGAEVQAEDGLGNAVTELDNWLSRWPNIK